MCLCDILLHSESEVHSYFKFLQLLPNGGEDWPSEMPLSQEIKAKQKKANRPCRRRRRLPCVEVHFMMHIYF